MAVVDKREAMRRVQRSLAGGRPDEALAVLWTLVDREHVPADELSAYLRAMADAYLAAGRPRAYFTIALFLGQLDLARRVTALPATDRARLAAAQGDRRAAAQAWLDGRWTGHAAIALEDAGDTRGARVLWERLGEDARLREDPYVAGLVRFNLARASAKLGDPVAARRAMVESVHLLEAAADAFEARGQRERAFDCFQVLLTIGKEGAFENLAEGYLGCIRILRQDNLKYYVLQYYDDFQQMALERGELVAAATLFREAADFARRHGLPFASHYLRRAGETHAASAQQSLRDGAPVELVENAYAAAIDTFIELGTFERVRELFDSLSRLELPKKRTARYERLRDRLTSVRNEAVSDEGLPRHLRLDTAYPAVWRLDVVEWEESGDAVETMGAVLADPDAQPFTRRRALVTRLAMIGTGDAVPREDTLVALAQNLGSTELYVALAPLEKLASSPSARVRAACMRAARQLYFKRTFVLVRQGLRDAEPHVRLEAVSAVSTLHFAHAFDPLARIWREATDPRVRRAALTAIGRVQAIEAVELLVDVLTHGDGEEKQLAREMLLRSAHPEATHVLKRAEIAEGGPARKDLTDIRRERERGLHG